MSSVVVVDQFSLVDVDLFCPVFIRSCRSVSGHEPDPEIWATGKFVGTKAHHDFLINLYGKYVIALQDSQLSLRNDSLTLLRNPIFHDNTISVKLLK